VTQALEDLGILYMIAGGVASIIHGEIRTTLMRISARGSPPRACGVAGQARFDPEFFVDAESIREAILSAAQAST